MEKMFEANKTMVALRDECSQHCPYVAKMIEAGSKLSLFVESFMSGPGQGNEHDMMELLEVTMRQFNQLCDWRSKAVCNTVNMHKSCSELVEAGGLEKNDLKELEEECDARGPCRRVCPGVDSDLFDLSFGQVKLTQQLPLPNTTLGVNFCKSVDRLHACTEHAECSEFLGSKISMGFDSAREYLESWEPTCAWFSDGCAAKRDEHCRKEVDELNAEWLGNYECMLFDVTEPCCKALQKAAACEHKVGCASHLNSGVPLLGLGLEARLPEQCPID